MIHIPMVTPGFAGRSEDWPKKKTLLLELMLDHTENKYLGVTASDGGGLQ